jgi:hypothetical protein
VSGLAPGTGPSPAQALLAFRIIGASLGVGITLFAGVSWVVHQQGGPVASLPLDPDLVANLLLLVTVVALAASIVLWRVRVAPLLERGRRGSGDPDGAELGAELQSRIILCWALVEAPAMLAVIVYFLQGSAWAGLFGVALIWIALGLTWPKREWFGA